MPRPPSRNTEKAPHAQVGMLMRAYRELFPREDGTQGITQRELLQRMAAVDGNYDKTSSHGAVSRWESGDTMPTVQRLVVFGRALSLTSAEVQGLILLAGLDPRHQETRTLTCPSCRGETETTLTEQVRQSIGAISVVTSAVRTRTCLVCGHAAQSTERWADHPEEIAQSRYGRILQRIAKANTEVRLALQEASFIQ